MCEQTDCGNSIWERVFKSWEMWLDEYRSKYPSATKEEERQALEQEWNKQSAIQRKTWLENEHAHGMCLNITE